MARPKTHQEKWPTLGVRIDPELYKTLTAHLRNPLYLRIPPGEMQNFITLAIRKELQSRGVECEPSQSSSSSTPSGRTTLALF